MNSVDEIKAIKDLIVSAQNHPSIKRIEITWEMVTDASHHQYLKPKILIEYE